MSNTQEIQFKPQRQYGARAIGSLVKAWDLLGDLVPKLRTFREEVEVLRLKLARVLDTNISKITPARARELRRLTRDLDRKILDSKGVEDTDYILYNELQLILKEIALNAESLEDQAKYNVVQIVSEGLHYRGYPNPEAETLSALQEEFQHLVTYASSDAFLDVYLPTFVLRAIEYGLWEDSDFAYPLMARAEYYQ